MMALIKELSMVFRLLYELALNLVSAAQCTQSHARSQLLANPRVRFFSIFKKYVLNYEPLT